MRTSTRRGSWSRESRPAVTPVGSMAVRAVAVRALAIGAAAAGAAAIGAAAIGSLAVGRLAVGRGDMRDLRIARLEIGDLVITRTQDGSPADVSLGGRRS
jgi:hypothetical protein